MEKWKKNSYWNFQISKLNEIYIFKKAMEEVKIAGKFCAKTPTIKQLSPKGASIRAGSGPSQPFHHELTLYGK